MVKKLRQCIVANLWQTYRRTTNQLQQIQQQLAQKNIHHLPLDHFAVIDLPGPNTGIAHLQKFFALLGFIKQGNDYLPCKQNDFLWMTEEDCFATPAKNVLPQVVVADFRVDEMPIEIKNIVLKYSTQSAPLPLAELQHSIADHDIDRATTIAENYFAGRDWPLPNVSEFKKVQAFNELLAWVLVFGRKPNHFTISVHLIPEIKNLQNFLQFVTDECGLALNADGGVIKGGANTGIAQASTNGATQQIQLADGVVDIPTGFVEFVWRYPLSTDTTPLLWKDFFSGFVAQHADHVIKSLYSD